MRCSSPQSIGQPCSQSDTATHSSSQLIDTLSKAGCGLTRSESVCQDAACLPFIISAGSSCSIGMRKEMEDLHRCEGFAKRSQSDILQGLSDVEQSNLPDLFAFTAVFDGHAGRRAAEFAEKHLYREIIERVNAQRKLEDTLAEAYAAVESKFIELAKAQETEWMDGTTAAAAILTLDEESGAAELTVGNVGDTEILLGNDTDFHEILSEKHTPLNPAEMDRIIQVGGREYKRRLGHPKYNPAIISLAVSRAIGDLFFKDEQFTDGIPSGLVAIPHITKRVLDKAHNWFFVLGCDGLWDVCDYSQVADFVRAKMKSNTPQHVSDALVQLAIDQGSPDNITVVVVYIQNVLELGSN